MVTTLLVDPLIDDYSQDDLAAALNDFGTSLSEEPVSKRKSFMEALKAYKTTAGKQTSDASKRKQRQADFIKAVKSLLGEKRLEQPRTDEV